MAAPAATHHQRLIDALARRAATHEGRVRALIEARVAALRELQANAASSASATPATPAASPLAALVEQLAAPPTGAASEPAPLAAPTELKALRYFRGTWTRLHAERGLAQSRAALPGNAGPLNSQLLVHRALTLMRETSPAYLHQFMAYAEGLIGLEQRLASAAPLAREAPRAKKGAAKEAKPPTKGAAKTRQPRRVR